MQERGCGKPGTEQRKGLRCFRATSPLLAADKEIGRLYECPLGYVMREAPWSLDAIRASSAAESAGFGIHEQSQFLQDAIAIVRSERERLREQEAKKDTGKADSSYAARVLKGGR